MEGCVGFVTQECNCIEIMNAGSTSHLQVNGMGCSMLPEAYIPHLRSIYPCNREYSRIGS